MKQKAHYSTVSALKTLTEKKKKKKNGFKQKEHK